MRQYMRTANFSAFAGGFLRQYMKKIDSAYFLIWISEKEKKYFESTILFLTDRKPSLGSCDLPQKFGPDQFSHFDVHWLQTENHLYFFT